MQSGSMQKKLEVTHHLERRAVPNGSFRNRLMGTFSILNLPAPYHCEKACKGCINKQGEAAKTNKREREDQLPPSTIRDIISLFAREFGTLFITINGRGDPFHPAVVHETMGKISHAHSVGIDSYVFTAGDNLDESTCKFLAESGTNVMISLFGNPFIDEGFFNGASYEGENAQIAANLSTLISAYQSSHNQPTEGLTRIGMNYVVGQEDADDNRKLAALKSAANKNGIFFICNRDFNPDVHSKNNGVLTALARTYSDFFFPHSTFADGVCQMGAGSSITVASNGDIYRCPYMLEGSDGNILTLQREGITLLFSRYLMKRDFSCVMRKTEIAKPKE